MRRRTGLIVALLALASLFAVAGPAAAQDEAAPVVFAVPLSGADPEGHGIAVLRIDVVTGELCYRILVQGIGEPTEPGPTIGNAHIHSATGIAVDLETDFVQVGEADVFVATGCVQVDAATLADILANPSAFYVNVHTVEFPAGAIEGTLG